MSCKVFRSDVFCMASTNKSIPVSQFSYSNLSLSATLLSGSEEKIIIPKMKTWNAEAVLQALASTVNRDTTASNYVFQDDSYLTPRTSREFKLYYLSQESGRNAAKYFINTFPRYFQKDFAEPHIPCLMPETLELQIDEVSERALTECIQLRKVKAAVDMFDQLTQMGSPVSLDLTNDLLDLICLYGDQEPAQDVPPEQRTNDMVRQRWQMNNNAERIFNMMPEPNSCSYGALIRGMVKHGSIPKAFIMYNDMLNNQLTADVHTFNALISAAPYLKEKYSEKWDLIIDLLKQMAYQKVKPNVLTFNAVLKALQRCGALGRVQAFPVLNEMKALGIGLSTTLLTPVHINFMCKVLYFRSPEMYIYYITEIILCVGLIFCLDTKDMEQAYKLQSLLDIGENWKLLGDSFHQSVYYGRFFNLLCMMEHVDVVLKWYRELSPSLFYPNSQRMRDLFQALDMDNRLDIIPQIWKDIKRMGHDNNTELVEEMLSLMAREKHKPEVQQSFAECALDVKTLYKQTDYGRVQLNWSASSLSIPLILGHFLGHLFKLEQNLCFLIYSEYLLKQFLDCIQMNNNSEQAVALVQISASFCLPLTSHLIKRVQQEFELNEEQKNGNITDQHPFIDLQHQWRALPHYDMDLIICKSNKPPGYLKYYYLETVNRLALGRQTC
uniref:Small ribosomal subunit protein mS39 n=1 Tax=Electrophorus electricus TaxID=8005 RepID=A0A4W4F631_ELEEL